MTRVKAYVECRTKRTLTVEVPDDQEVTYNTVLDAVFATGELVDAHDIEVDDWEVVE